MATTPKQLPDLIRLGTIDEVRRAGNLLEQHWRELCTDPDTMQLDPDWHAYYELEERGRTLVLIASKAGRTVGYSLNLIGPHLHYRNLVVCQNDVLFLAKEHRRGVMGTRLLHKTESAAKERGAHVMAWHAKQGTALEHVLPKMGYGVQDIYYTRSL